jgi:hypothetical protein
MLDSFRLFLALGLSLSLFVGAISTGSVEGINGLGSPYAIHFPWVPNGATLSGLGPFYGTVTIQNLEAEEIVLYYKATDEGDLGNLSTYESAPVDALGAVTLSAATIGVPSPGAGVVALAHIAGEEENNIQVLDEEPTLARIAGVQKQAATVAPLADARTSAAHQTVGGYTGLTEWEIGKRSCCRSSRPTTAGTQSSASPTSKWAR